MATEAWGLEGRNMVLLYSEQSIYGTAVTPATAVGICNFESDVPSGIEAVFGFDDDALFIKEGIVIPTVRLSNLILQSKTFLDAISTRTSGQLPWYTLGLGYLDDAGTMYARQLQDCKIGRWGLSLEASEQGGLLVVPSLEFTGRKPTTLTSLAQANLATAPWHFRECILTKGGAAFESDRFSVDVSESLRTKSTIPGAAPTAGEERLYTYLKEGRRVISGEVTRAARHAVDTLGNPMSDFSTILAATQAGGGSAPNSMTVTIGGCKFGGAQQSGGPDEEFRETAPFLAKTIAIT